MKNLDKMTRWANKQPSLRMADGGSARPLETGPKPNPLTPGAPQTPIPNWMRYSLREGREVPGEGEGDKVPALLEPDEFVVSNSMMKRHPSLRAELHEIRDETLQSEGKNPAEVDAKQERQATLRASEGWEPKNGNLAIGYGPQGITPGSHRPIPGGLNDMQVPKVVQDIGSALSSGGDDVGQSVKKFFAGDTPGPLAPTPGGLNTPEGVRSVFGMSGAGAGRGQVNPEPVNPTLSAPQPEPQSGFAAPNAQARSLRQGVGPSTEEGVVRRVGNSFSGTDVAGYGNQSVVPAMDPGLIRQTLRNPDGSTWGAADNARMAQNIRDGIDPKAGTSGQVRDPIAEFAAAAPKRGEFGFRGAQNDLARMRGEAVQTRGQDISSAAQTRGQDITSADSRYGHELSTEVSRNRLRYDMGKDQRDYLTGRADKAFEQENTALGQRSKADEDWTKHASTLFTGADGKPDTNAVANYTRTTDHTIGLMIKEFSKSNDPAKVAYAAKLAKVGRAGLDPADRDAMLNHFRTKVIGDKSIDGVIDPFSGSGTKSDDLREYSITGDANGLLQKRAKTKGGMEIPVTNLQYGADANNWGYNSGPADNTLVPKRLRD